MQPHPAQDTYPSDPTLAAKVVRPRNQKAADADPVAALRAQVEQKGGISSSAIRDFVPPDAPGTPAPPTPEEMAKEKAERIPPDPMAVAVEQQQDAIADAARDWNDKPLAVTDEDKTQFKLSLSTMTRFRRRITLCDGALTVVIRSRTSAESNAVANWHRLLITNQMVPPESYQSHLRAGLLAAQIESINAETFPELEKPLLARPTGHKSANGAATFIPPAWHERAVRRWIDEASLGLVNELMNQLVEFERVYYVLLDGARNQNFWRTAAST